MVPFVPASTIGFGIIFNKIVPTLLGHTPFGEEAVSDKVTFPVWPVAGVYVVAVALLGVKVPKPLEALHCKLE